MSCYMPTSNIRASANDALEQNHIFPDSKKRSSDIDLIRQWKKRKLSDNTPPASPGANLPNRSSASSLGSVTDCSLNYLDTLPTNLSKVCHNGEYSWGLTHSNLHSSHQPQLDSDDKLGFDFKKSETFYINWRKNFEDWLLLKNPTKYSEFKSFLKFTKGAPAGNDIQVPAKKTNSIREKINHYLVSKPAFNLKISKKFKKKNTELSLQQFINKATPLPSASTIPPLIIPKNTDKNAASGIRLPSINEIFDNQNFPMTRVVTPIIPTAVMNQILDRRSISTSSMESNNSMFSETGVSNNILIDDGLTAASMAVALSPPLIAFKTDQSQSPEHHDYAVTSPQKSPKKSPKKFSKPIQSKRTCLSCGSSQSPCWRPSWSVSGGQLCNSCGLRYKKTNARCLNNDCLRIPAKSEFNLIKSKSHDTGDDLKCLRCGFDVEVNRISN